MDGNANTEDWKEIQQKIENLRELNAKMDESIAEFERQIKAVVKKTEQAN